MVKKKIDIQISLKAKEWIKKNKRILIERFANDSICPSLVDPSTILMAGSPGAGKTEFSRNLIKENKFKAVRIDADDIRELLPQYTGKNSDVVHGAASIGVEKLYDYVLQKKKSTIIDGTFVNYKVSSQNIQRSLDKGRNVAIFYVYQDPKIAWEFTRIREKEEGRYIPKDAFVDAFIKARENVERAKAEFGNRVKLHVVEKDYSNGMKNFYTDVVTIDENIKYQYNKNTLKKYL